MKLEIDGLRETSETSREQSRRARDLRPAMKAIAADIESFTKARFASEEDPEGQPWKKLAPSTVKRKGSAKILVETGALRQSIFARAQQLSVQFGAGVDYASFHQFGSGGFLPSRSFLPVGGAQGSPQPVDEPPGSLLYERAENIILSYIITGRIDASGRWRQRARARG